VVRALDRDWCLRSGYSDFDIVARSWLSSGPLRCYSVGWGIVHGGQTDRLLLGQAFVADRAAGERLGALVTEELAATTGWHTWSVREQWGRTCLSVAAELRRPPDE